MAVTVTGVPEKISRADRDQLVRSLGFDVDDLVKLTFGVRSITAAVYARDAEGHRYADGDQVAVHNIALPVED